MQIELPYDDIVAFTHRWNLTEFTLFGFGSSGDVLDTSSLGVVVEFEDDSDISLFDLGRMYAEVESIFGERVDLVTRYGVDNSRNPIRQQHILDTSRVVYRLEDVHERV